VTLTFHRACAFVSLSFLKLAPTDAGCTSCADVTVSCFHDRRADTATAVYHHRSTPFTTAAPWTLLATCPPPLPPYMPSPQVSRLLALPLSSLTAERVDAVGKERDAALVALATLEARTAVDLWLDDLAVRWFLVKSFRSCVPPERMCAAFTSLLIEEHS